MRCATEQCERTCWTWRRFWRTAESSQLPASRPEVVKMWPATTWLTCWSARKERWVLLGKWTCLAFFLVPLKLCLLLKGLITKVALKLYPQPEQVRWTQEELSGRGSHAPKWKGAHLSWRLFVYFPEYMKGLSCAKAEN